MSTLEIASNMMLFPSIGLFFVACLLYQNYLKIEENCGWIIEDYDVLVMNVFRCIIVMEIFINGIPTLYIILWSFLSGCECVFCWNSISLNAYFAATRIPVVVTMLMAVLIYGPQPNKIFDDEYTDEITLLFRSGHSMDEIDYPTCPAYTKQYNLYIIYLSVVSVTYLPYVIIVIVFPFIYLYHVLLDCVRGIIFLIILFIYNKNELN